MSQTDPRRTTPGWTNDPTATHATPATTTASMSTGGRPGLAEPYAVDTPDGNGRTGVGSHTVAVPVPTDRIIEREGRGAQVSDRVRWGPIWAGFVVAMATFFLVQLALFALDATDLDLNPTAATTQSATFWTILAAAIGFFLGGMVAGATAKWRSATDGIIQGVVLWGLVVVALVAASSFAIGTLGDAVGGIAGRLVTIRDQLTAGSSLSTTAVEDARDAAADACLFLGITVAVTALGALIGAKLWPRRRHLDETAFAGDDRHRA